MASNRDPAFIQRVIRESAKERCDFVGELNDWTTEMKAKEVAATPGLLKNFDTNPARNMTTSKEKSLNSSEETAASIEKKKIKACDYSAWEKFDAEKACEEVSTIKQKQITEEELIKQKALKIKSKELAVEKKELGNLCMKAKNYDQAISAYSIGIEHDPKNSILFANRAQAYIFKGELKKAKDDCDEALKIDGNYVKVLYRRAKLNVDLGCPNEAESDLQRALKLEPKNVEVQNLLKELRQKRLNSDRPANSHKVDCSDKLSRQILKAKATKYTTPNITRNDERKCDAINAKGDCDVYPKVIKPINKPPQQRSKRPLFPLYVKVVGQKEDSTKKKRIDTADLVHKSTAAECTQANIPVNSTKDSSQLEKMFSKMNVDNLPAKPTTAAQFEMHWKQLKSAPEYFAHYLKQMTADDYKIFQNAMESPMLSDIIDALIWEFIPQKWDIVPHMEGLLKVRRFGTLVMFMTEKDRASARKLVSLCPETIKSQYSKLDI